METFHARISSAGGVISTRAPWIRPEWLPTNPGANNPFASGNLGGFNYDPLPEAMALLAIYNKRGSGKLIRIREIEITPLPACNSNVSCRLILQRISAASGGINGNIINLDSNNASLTNVVFAVNTNITTTDSSFWQMLMIPSLAGSWNYAGSATYAPFWKEIAFGGLDKNQDSKFGCSQLYMWKANSDLQKIVLRNGEGIAVHTNSATNMNLEYSIAVWVRNVTTGACYVAQTIAVSGEGALFSLMNNSADVIEILRVELTEQGNSLGPLYSLESIENLIPERGEAVTPTKMDSANTLDSNILCCKNCYVQIEGFSAGALLSNPMKSWINGRGPGIAPNVNQGPIPIKNTMYNEKAGSSWVLREGSGVAVINRGWANNSDYDIIIKFTQETVSTGSSGGGGHVLGRSGVR